MVDLSFVGKANKKVESSVCYSQNLLGASSNDNNFLKTILDLYKRHKTNVVSDQMGDLRTRRILYLHTLA